MKKLPGVKLPPAPRYLSKLAKEWWSKINREYELPPDALLLLESAMQALDRWKEAQAILDKDGLTTTDRFGQVKAHPATVIERDSRSALIRGLKQLGLDLEPVHDRPGRPAGSLKS